MLRSSMLCSMLGGSLPRAVSDLTAVTYQLLPSVPFTFVMAPEGATSPEGPASTSEDVKPDVDQSQEHITLNFVSQASSKPTQ